METPSVSRTVDGFTARLEGVAPERWSAPSPCTDWTARDIAVHVINVHQRVLSSVGGTEPIDVLSNDDPATRWTEAWSAVRDSLNDDDRASKIVGGAFGEQPFESQTQLLNFCGRRV